MCALSNSALPPNFTPSAGLIAPPGANGPGAGTTYISTAFLPLNHPGLIGAQPITYAPNGGSAAPAGTFYTASAQQKQQLPPVQQHVVNAGPAANAGQQQAVAYYPQPLPPAPLNNNNSNNNAVAGGGGNGAHRANIRGGQRSTPPQQANYYAYTVPTAAPQPRPTLVNNAAAAAVAPILNPRSTPLNGAPTFHIPPAYNIPIVPQTNLTTAPMLAAAGMTAAPTAPATGLHTYSPAVAAVAGVPGVAGVAAGFPPTSLTTASQLAGSDKVKERRHAIPIIHPDTKENVLDPKSSVFIKKDSNSTLTSSTGSDSSLPQYQLSGMSDSGSSSQLITGVMVDHQMQTDKALQPHSTSHTAAAAALPLTDEDKVSVIVKDILAHSGNPDEHLSFWQFNDGKINKFKVN